ncbi:hypothetical protein [Propionimicrobium sp. PCR01-08-3]|uniref:hypothetical protein n=1 Tax=Propionimicrobium sp. PCR01-08-3 TaxID=3052086 RepID=UPI00255D00BD|nr:hypothetical protein [Propionimicrobium sp. PCR01-08-3]WIY81391.1 hypothetical protein QQ658_07470 [Propionimicrobium sp. PCR01-08-3]
MNQRKENRSGLDGAGAVSRANPVAGNIIPNRLNVGRGISRVDLRRVNDVDREIKGVVDAPRGTAVVLVVNPRQRIPLAIDYLREYGGNLGSVNVECPHDATRLLWLDALTNGAAQWVDALGGAA